MPPAIKKTSKPETKPAAEALRTDGPTLEEFVAAGYKEENYPPAGYAPRASSVAPVAPVMQPTPTATTEPLAPVGSPLPSAPKRKFYHALNSNRFIQSNGFQFSFSPYQHVGGMWMGLFTTDKPDEIAALDALVAGKKSAVTELTEEEYNEDLKKKAVALQSSGQSLIHLEASASSQQSATVAAPLDSEPAAPAPAAPVAETTAEALVTGSVEVAATS